MSRLNKVNKDHYTQRGRLTADEAARERAKQRQKSPRSPAAAVSAPAAGARTRKKAATRVKK